MKAAGIDVHSVVPVATVDAFTSWGYMPVIYVFGTSSAYTCPPEDGWPVVVKAYDGGTWKAIDAGFSIVVP